MAAYAALTATQQRDLRRAIILAIKTIGASNEENAQTHDQLHALITNAEA